MKKGTLISTFVVFIIMVSCQGKNKGESGTLENAQEEQPYAVAEKINSNILSAMDELKNGKIELTPQVLIDTADIPPKTLKMINSSMKNFKKGKVSKPIDLSEFETTNE